MSAECRKCGRDLDGDFKCGTCSCEIRYELLKAQADKLAEAGAAVLTQFHSLNGASLDKMSKALIDYSLKSNGSPDSQA